MKETQPSYNKETVGTAIPQEDCNDRCRGGATFGDAIEHLRKGGLVQREGWNDKGMFVFKQVPSKVPAEIVPKMSSLPQHVKDYMQAAKISPNYQCQMAIVTPDGNINSWVASSADTFATDWILN